MVFFTYRRYETPICLCGKGWADCLAQTFLRRNTRGEFLYLKLVTVGEKLCAGEPRIFSKLKCILEKSLIHNFEMLNCYIHL